MNKVSSLTIFYLALTLAFSGFALGQGSQGGPYKADPAVVAGGGGQVSSGGTYGVGGTLAQALAGGPINGNGFGLNSGFWNIFIVAPPGISKTFGGSTVVYGQQTTLTFTLQ